jgi:hypothetical protein
MPIGGTMREFLAGLVVSFAVVGLVCAGFFVFVIR